MLERASVAGDRRVARRRGRRRARAGERRRRARRGIWSDLERSRAIWSVRCAGLLSVPLSQESFDADARKVQLVQAAARRRIAMLVFAELRVRSETCVDLSQTPTVVLRELRREPIRLKDATLVVAATGDFSNLQSSGMEGDIFFGIFSEMVSRRGLCVMVKRYKDGASYRLNHEAPAILYRDLDEARVCSHALCVQMSLVQRLVHPHVLPVIAFLADVAIELVCVVTPFMERGSLQSVIEPSPLRMCDDEPLNSCKLLKIMCDAMRGTTFLHEEGLVHRDLKPGNILVGEDWVGVVADFGFLARMDDGTEDDEICGTKGYIDPASNNSNQLAPSMDAFSLGITLLVVITGLAPINISKTCRPMLHDPDERRKWMFGEGPVVLPPAAIPGVLRVVAGLTKYDEDERMSLPDALQQLEFANQPHVPEAFTRAEPSIVSMSMYGDLEHASVAGDRRVARRRDQPRARAGGHRRRAHVEASGVI